MAARGLIVASRLPWPLDDGWKVRTWHCVEALASTRPVTLVVGSGASAQAITEARAAWEGRVELVEVPFGRRNSLPRLLAGLLTHRPIQYLNQRTRAAHERVASLVASNQYGVGIAVTAFMWPYLEHLGQGCLRVLDTHNVDSVNLERYIRTLPAGPRQWYARRTVANLRSLEAEVFNAADQVWVCSGDEARVVAASRRASGTYVVPNGVDTTRFTPIDGSAVPNRLIFFGRLDYHPNTDAVLYFLNEIFPRIRQDIPSVHCQIVGPGAPPALVEAIATAPGVELVGRVDDVPSTIATASVVVVPLRAGGGTRLKILEAMAVGRPVVSTTIGAEGLAMTDTVEIAIADVPLIFADRVVALLRDPAAASALGARGRASVLARHDWAMIRAEMSRLTRQVKDR